MPDYNQSSNPDHQTLNLPIQCNTCHTTAPAWNPSTFDIHNQYYVVEINNTDAEGRLTLGDAITYVRQKVQPDEMFDFATLSGACMVALGPYTAGVMSDHDALLKTWLNAAERTGEDMWRLPLNSRLREQRKSPIADMRNTGDRFGGAITAGLFLKTFAKDTPWVHVDIAGPASVSSARPSQPKGGTGFAVATMVEYATRR